jgi:hypothetical protein
VFAGILLLLIIAAVTAPNRSEESGEPGPSESWEAGEETEKKVLEATVSVFFWLALVGLAAVIVTAYT